MNDIITNKFVISCDPSRSKGEDCVIAALYGSVGSVAYCTLKDNRWYELPVEIRDYRADIAFCKGKLHLLLGFGRQACQIIVFENFEPNPRTTLIARQILVPSDAITSRSNLDSSFTVYQNYLVESSDQSCIFIVERYVRCSQIQSNIEDLMMCRTLYFKVRKVNPVNGSIVEVKGIGEDVKVLGMNTPVSISSRNCIGYKRNHIYFTDCKYIHDRLSIKADACEIGVFSLDDGTLKPLRDFKFIWPPPIWLDVS